MNIERINQIKGSLAGLGTKSNELYTNQEIVDSLLEFQNALVDGVFQKTHAENLHGKDLMIHFTALAKEYGLDETETFHRFESNMNNMGDIIRTYINGMRGEKATRKALKLLSYDENVKILYNVQLKDHDPEAELEAEYDAIVLMPAGIFVIEVKNWGGAVIITPEGQLKSGSNSNIVYDLVGRLGVKEALLRELLGKSFPAHYQNLLAFPYERTIVEDSYHEVPFVCGGGVTNKIRQLSSHDDLMTAEQIGTIERIINEHQEVQKAPSPVNCDAIAEDYAFLMASIEEESAKRADSAQAEEPKEEDKEEAKPDTAAESDKDSEPAMRINWGKVGEIAACFAGVALTGVACALASTHFKRY